MLSSIELNALVPYTLHQVTQNPKAELSRVLALNLIPTRAVEWGIEAYFSHHKRTSYDANEVASLAIQINDAYSKYGIENITNIKWLSKNKFQATIGN